MAKEIKEIYVSVVPGPLDRNGNPTSSPLYRSGRPIAADVYTPEHLPPKTTWDQLCAWAQKEHVNNHGVTIFQEGDDLINAEARKAMEAEQVRAAEQRELQAEVAKVMARGEIPDVEKIKADLARKKPVKAPEVKE